MDISSFLEKVLHEPDVLFKENYVLFIGGAEKAPLFYAQVVSFMARALHLSVTTIDVRASATTAHFDALLDISFLGQPSLYSFQQCQAASSAHQKYVQQRLASYQGPHYVIAQTDALQDHHYARAVCVEVTSTPSIDYMLYEKLFYFFTGKPLHEKEFAYRLFQLHPALAVEEACRILQYQALLGKHTELFIDEWLGRLVPSDHSLFQLSQFLFARQSQAFLSLWRKVSVLYPDEFWLAFWSEQLWQAVIFTQEAASSSPALARKLVNRLPFSFINKDWQKYSFLELVRAHQFLYSIDYQLKNGTGSCGLELFYARFLHKLFR